MRDMRGRLRLIIVGRRTIRSLWSLVLFCVGAMFLLLGLSCVVAGWGLFATLLYSLIAAGGAAICSRAARMGAVRCRRGVVIREFLATSVLQPGSILAVTVGQVEHDYLPFHTVFPSIALADGDEIPVMSLATYDFIPGSRRQVTQAVNRLIAWADRHPE